jgi:hypothetical protein
MDMARPIHAIGPLRGSMIQATVGFGCRPRLPASSFAPVLALGVGDAPARHARSLLGAVVPRCRRPIRDAVRIRR